MKRSAAQWFVIDPGGIVTSDKRCPSLAVVIRKCSRARSGSQIKTKNTTGGMWRRVVQSPLCRCEMVNKPDGIEPGDDRGIHIFPDVHPGRRAIVEIAPPLDGISSE